MGCYLPRCCVSPEIGEHSCKPVVDLVQSQLSVGGFQDGLANKVKRKRKKECERMSRGDSNGCY